MAFNYVNGVGYPRVSVFRISDNSLVEMIDLDLCGLEGGFREGYAEAFKRNITQQGRIIDFDFTGSRIIFVLDYSEDIEKANSFSIERIANYNSQPENYRLILTPRVDILKRRFEVRMLDGAYDMGVQTGGTYAKGNTLTVIKFITTNTGSKNFVDPLGVYVPFSPFYVPD